MSDFENYGLAIRLYLQGDSLDQIINKVSFSKKRSLKYCISEVEEVIDNCFVKSGEENKFFEPANLLESKGYPSTADAVESLMKQLDEHDLVQRRKRFLGNAYVPTVSGIDFGMRILDEENPVVMFPREDEFLEHLDYIGVFELAFDENYSVEDSEELPVLKNTETLKILEFFLLNLSPNEISERLGIEVQSVKNCIEDFFVGPTESSREFKKTKEFFGSIGELPVTSKLEFKICKILAENDFLKSIRNGETEYYLPTITSYEMGIRLFEPTGSEKIPPVAWPSDKSRLWKEINPFLEEIENEINKPEMKDTAIDFLPPVQNLTDEQDKAMRTDAFRSIIVTGPPGSGKTVVSLYRINELKNERGRNVDLFVYSKVLFSYLRYSLKKLNIISSDTSEEVKTFHKWFYSWFLKNFKKKPPSAGGQFNYDWDEVRNEIVRNISSIDRFDQLIVDEAQDIPIKFFKYAAKLSKAHTVFADDNQAIFEQNSSVAQIRAALQRYEPEMVRLKSNHRNTLQIAKLANCFAVKGIESGTADLPTRHGNKPELCEGSIDDYAERMVSFAKNNSTQTVGVFLPTKKEVEKWFLLLREKGIRKIQRYYWDNDRRLDPPDFTQKSIILVTFHSSKGLEFDSVFIPRIDNLVRKDSTKMNLYVALSRPRENLSLHHEHALNPDHVFVSSLRDMSLIEKVVMKKKETLDI